MKFNSINDDLNGNCQYPFVILIMAFFDVVYKLKIDGFIMLQNINDFSKEVVFS